MVVVDRSFRIIIDIKAGIAEGGTSGLTAVALDGADSGTLIVTVLHVPTSAIRFIVTMMGAGG